jgi:serine/threonine protein kinase
MFLMQRLKMPFTAAKRAKLAADAMREATILASLHHDNILRFRGVVFDERRLPKYIVTERADCNLAQYLERRRGRLDNTDVIKIARQVLRGLVYIHSLSPPIVHRDIKLENVLVFIVDGTVTFKIADVGLARFADSTLSVAGTPLFMAPDLKDGTDDVRCDMFSFGLMLTQMVLEYMVTPCKNLAKDYDISGRLRAVEDAACVLGEPLASLLRGCAKRDSSDRLHAVDALGIVDGGPPAAAARTPKVCAYVYVCVRVSPSLKVFSALHAGALCCVDVLAWNDVMPMRVVPRVRTGFAVCCLGCG